MAKERRGDSVWDTRASGADMTGKPKGRSRKTAVISNLGEKHGQGAFPEGIVTGDQIRQAMDEVGSNLSRNNPANFLKDLLRKNPENNWPDELLAQRIYGLLISTQK
ncbi:hypothetical protein ACFOM8_22735 [Paracoccus angustae]|uniref:DUF5681 domain-containing protein n=1 Tax=Paracoccus angustae TaxID=1671480 RepID=A0ABV7UBC6_9RHOB